MRQIALLALTALAGCSTWPSFNFLTPHKIDIQQGNFVKQEDVAKLKPGMSRSEVKAILGTPLLADPFHANRWDYLHRFRKGGTLIEERRVTVIFEDDRLARLEGDVVPATR